jgi:hypothetical protein
VIALVRLSLRWLRMRRRPVSAALLAFAIVLGTSTVLERLNPVGQSSDTLIAADLHVPVRLADPAMATLLQPGDVISVMASTGSLGSAAETIAEHLRIITVSTAISSGTNHGALIVVATDARRAALLAGAAQATLTVVIHRN